MMDTRRASASEAFEPTPRTSLLRPRRGKGVTLLAPIFSAGPRLYLTPRGCWRRILFDNRQGGSDGFETQHAPVDRPSVGDRRPPARGREVLRDDERDCGSRSATERLVRSLRDGMVCVAGTRRGARGRAGKVGGGIRPPGLSGG